MMNWDGTELDAPKHTVMKWDGQGFLKPNVTELNGMKVDGMQWNCMSCNTAERNEEERNAFWEWN